MNERQHTRFPARRADIPSRRRSRFLAAALLAPMLVFFTPPALAQSSSDAPDVIHGTVVNGITHQPIPRALVLSPDNRFATMTDNQGRFEFALPKAENPNPTVAASTEGISAVDVQVGPSNRLNVLTARKPGFLETDDGEPFLVLTQDAREKDVTLSLVPEAIVTGRVSLPTSEAPDSIQLQLFRRQVNDGRAHWIPAGTASSRSTGEFRFAELHPGTYKLLSEELLDRDPLTYHPPDQLYGYPPVYHQDAADFDSATTIQLSAGQTVQAHISLVKQPYYNVKIAVENAPQGFGLNVTVYSQGHHGPGYALGYNPDTQAIDGMLPNGTYTVEATSFGQTMTTGLVTITVKGASVEGARLALVPGAAIPINVKEEFTDREAEGFHSTFSDGKHTFTLRGPRRYLNITLESADEFDMGRNAFLQPPKGPQDEELSIANVPPGRYWVRVQSSRGFAASLRSGTTDLQHEPLVVGAGRATFPIEITMRDDFATVEGNVEGMTPPAPSETLPAGIEGNTPFASARSTLPQVIFVPLPDSGGEEAEIPVAPDGSFASQTIAPGTYRVLAFDHRQPELEYRNPEAMKAYDSKGSIVRVAGGQKEHVTLHLISTSE